MTMAVCTACKKEIFFSEKTTFLGADLHASCFKCQQCKKILVVGKHLENDGKPLCCHCHAVITGNRQHARGPPETFSFYGPEYGK